MERLNRRIRSLPVLATAVIVVMAIILAAGLLVTLRASQTLETLHELAEDADRVTDRGAELLVNLLDAESNARAYVLTRRSIFLTPYTAASVATAACLSRLSDAAGHFSHLTDDVHALQGLVAARLALLQQSIQKVDTGSDQTIQAMLGSDAGPDTMRLTRRLLDRLVLHATEERDHRSAEENRRERAIRFTVMLGGVAGVLLLGTAALALLANRDRLLRTQHALQLQAAQWQATVENLQDGVAVFDAAGRLVQWNQNFAPLTGLPTALLRQGTPYDAFVAAAAGWQPAALASATPGDALAGAPRGTELRIVGRVLDFWCNAMPGGGRMLTFGDITRRVEAEAIARQAQKMDVLGQLTGGVAHDFNNLLQVVSANLELMSTRLGADDAPPPAWLRSRLLAAMEGVNRGARLTRHLLAFARRQPLAPEAIDPTRLLAGLEDMLRRTLGPAVALEQVVAEDLWALRADVQQLENALLNLAINARDAMAGNQPARSRLTIEARNAALDAAYCAANADVVPGQYVMVAVSDCGCGMTAEQLALAVEPFYTTKPEGQGTGLGLSMVYGFAKQSGGHLKLYSEPGHGTTARLYIPRAMTAVAAQEAVRAPLEPGRGETVLLVEDDPAVRMASALALRSLGYRVEEAPTADEAMAMLEKGLRPDLIFTDVMMPGTLSARTMTERATALAPGVAVLFTSGYTENSIVHKGQLDPHVQLISKPWRIEELARRLRQTLDAARHPRPAQCRILLVEDDVLVRMVTADMLADMGHEVIEASDAEEALARLAGVELLITDIGLGKIDGMELARLARARLPELRVIVASGGAAPAAGVERMVWLSKPYDNAALQAALLHVMQEAGAPSP